jgi:hypothetical protein
MSYEHSERQWRDNYGPENYDQQFVFIPKLPHQTMAMSS